MPGPRGRALDTSEDQAWFQHHVMRLRLALRYAKSRQTEAILKEVITDAEARLAALTDQQLKKLKDSK
jgi:hypothetical protein